MDELENTRLVQQVYQQFAARDAETLVNLLAADIEWRLPAMEHVPFAGTWKGRDGVRQFLRELGSSQDVIDFRPEQFVAQDNTVIVLGRFVMRVKQTGKESVSDWAHVWTIDGGKVAQFKEYVDTAAVSRAHG